LAWRKKTRLCFVQYAFISELTSAIALTNRFHLFPVIIDANSTTTAPYSREPHLISHFPQLYPHSFITIEFIPTMSTPPDNISIWKELWSAGETPWTLPSLNPALKKHGASFFGEAGDSILFPLCGKSIDMILLADKYKVAGIEGVEEVFTEFSIEHNASLREVKSDINGYYKRIMDIPPDDDLNTSHSTIDLYLGDIFAMNPNKNRIQYDRVFDRGSLVAIDPTLRRKYMQIISSLLKPGGKWMLASFCYNEREMVGPPYSIGGKQIQSLLAQLEMDEPGTKFEFELLEQTRTEISKQGGYFCKKMGGPLSTAVDCVIVITKIQ